MDHEYVKVNEGKDWLPKSWRLSTFPIAEDFASGPKDIVGSAFLIQHLDRNFIVSARHVIDRVGLSIIFPAKDSKFTKVTMESIKEMGLEWVHHPYEVDIAALCFPPGLSYQIESLAIIEKYWTVQSKLKLGSDVKHLGFPDRVSANFGDGTSGPIPVGMPGVIIGFEGISIQIRTSGAPGASGGPAIMRGNEDVPHLIGVVTDIRLFGTQSKRQDAIPLYQTTVIPISTVKDILDTDEMRAQLKTLGPSGPSS